jgi:peroxiredoxin Q/BCP
MRSGLAVAALVLVFAAAESAAQVDPKSPNVQPPTPTRTNRSPSGQLGVSGRVFVGERAPDFELSDPHGQVRKLSQLRGDWVLLVFIERKEQLTTLAELHHELQPMGVRLLALSGDNPQSLRAYGKRQELPFEVLSDPMRQIAAVYGLFDRARNWTLPGFLVLDREGIVQMALLGQALPNDQIAALTRYTMDKQQ